MSHAVLALHGYPVLLVEPDCIPPKIDAELDRLHPARIYLLGGSGAISSRVAAGKVCSS